MESTNIMGHSHTIGFLGSDRDQPIIRLGARAPNAAIGLTHFPSLPFHRATIPRSDVVGDLLSDPPPPLPHSLQVLSNGVQSSSSNRRSERKWGWDVKMHLFGCVEESIALNHSALPRSSKGTGMPSVSRQQNYNLFNMY